MNQYGGESHVRYDSIPVDHIGDLDVTGWRLCGPCVNLSIDGRVNVGFDMSPANARALAAQLIAAADYAEGR